MSRLTFLFGCLLMVVAFLPVPLVQAQAADPANLLPADLVVYVQMRVDENIEADLRDLLQLLADFTNDTATRQAASDFSFDAVLSRQFPGIRFEEDILPWLGGEMGVAITGNLDASEPDFVAVIPITEDTAIRDYASALPNALQRDDLTIYPIDPYRLAITPDAIWLGTQAGIDAALAVRKGSQPALGGDPAFRATWAQLPDNSLMAAYISGQWLAEEMSQGMMEMNIGPGPRELAELILRLHPAASPMEEALLQFPPLNGIALALDLNSERLDITGVLSLDARYPAPTLPVSDTHLLDYIPGDTVLLLDSYDMSVLLAGGGGMIGYLALIGPAVGDIFDSLVFSLENPGVPTPTVPPTPTPLPTPTSDDLIAQAQPIIQQAETLLGITLPELAGLLSGEYALAFFPVDNPSTDNQGLAIWVVTDGTDQLSAVMDKAMTLLQAQMGTSGALQRQEQTISGAEIVLWSAEGENDGIVYGALADDVFFITLQSSLDRVLDASHGDGVLAQAPSWPGDIAAEYGPDYEALMYLDWPGMVTTGFAAQTGTDSPIGAIIQGVDVQADGLFIYRATFQRTDR